VKLDRKVANQRRALQACIREGMSYSIIPVVTAAKAKCLCVYELGSCERRKQRGFRLRRTTLFSSIRKVGGSVQLEGRCSTCTLTFPIAVQ